MCDLDKFVRGLIADLGDCDGADLRINGETLLVTSYTQIAAYLAWHVHGETETGNQCLCGWSAPDGCNNPRGEVKTHADQATEALLAAARTLEARHG